MEIKFNNMIVTDKLKIHVSVDERVTSLNTVSYEEKNPIVRMMEGYFSQDGNFINKLFNLAQGETAYTKKDEVYTYDANSNRTSKDTMYDVGTMNRSRNYEYDTNSNQLTSDGIWEYTYDKDGNLSTKSNDFASNKYECTLQGKVSIVSLQKKKGGLKDERNTGGLKDRMKEMLLIFY